MSKKNITDAGRALRMFAGIILLYLSISGIRNAISSFRKDNPVSIIITVIAIPICILFILIACTMLFGEGLSSRKKKKLIPSCSEPP